MSKKCIDCKHLNKELAFCRACGAKWLNDKDGENCKYFEKITSPTLFDQITASPDVLAPYFIDIKTDDLGTILFYSKITKTLYSREEVAFIATVAKLKEVAE